MSVLANRRRRQLWTAVAPKTFFFLLLSNSDWIYKNAIFQTQGERTADLDRMKIVSVLHKHLEKIPPDLKTVLLCVVC